MTESDDVGKLFGGGSTPDIPEPVTAGNVQRTAKRVDQPSETASKNKRLSASLLTEGFSTPKLGQSGLLGILN
jgi:hypothetical protein